MATTGKSRLTEIYLSEKSEGRGAASAIGKRTLEKIDPRQMFNQQGFLAAFLPSLFKAYKAPMQIKKEKDLSSRLPIESSKLDTKIEELITDNKIIRVNSTITAKNIMVLPAMARDMNLMRQNISKLVKLNGGVATNKSDMFFRRVSEREKDYESKFNKTTSPTPKGAGTTTDNKKEPGFFDFLLNFVKKFLAGVAGFAIIGALIAGIGKILENEETKNKVKEFLVDAFVAIFNGIKRTITLVSETLSDPRVVEAMVDTAKEFFIQLKNVAVSILSHEVETPFGKFNIGTIIAAVVGTFYGLKLALIGLTAAIVQASRNIMLGGAAGTAGTAGAAGGIAGKIFKVIKKVGPLAVIGGALYYLNEETGEATKAPEGTPIPPGTPRLEEKDIQTMETTPSAGVNQDSRIKENQEMSVEKKIEAAVYTGAAVYGGSQVIKNTPELMRKTGDAVLDARTQSVGQLANSKPTTKWGRFLAFVAKKSPNLYGKIALKLAQSAALMAIPWAGWILAAVNMGFTLWSAYELFQLWKEFNGIDTDESKDVSETTPYVPSPEENNVPPAAPVMTPSPTLPTPLPATAPTTGTPVAPVVPAEAGRGFNRVTTTSPTSVPTTSTSTPTAPTPVSAPIATPRGGVFDSWDLYRHVIGHSESGNQYNTRFNVFDGKAKVNDKLITENTIGEIIQWQKSEKQKKTNAHGIGKYAIMDVEYAAQISGLKHDQLFDAAAQEQMMVALTKVNRSVLMKGARLRKSGEYYPGLGREPEMWEMQLAHSVGAGGALKLIHESAAGQGNVDTAEKLGLQGTSRSTNPHLQKSINTVLQNSRNMFSPEHLRNIKAPDAGTVTATPSTPPPAPSAAASVPPSPTSGNILASMTRGITESLSQPQPVVINAPTNVQSQAPAQSIVMPSSPIPCVFDMDFMRELGYKAT